MIFIIERNVNREVFPEIGLDAVVVRGAEQADAASDPAGIGVDDEKGEAARVQEHRVRGFGADALDGKESFAAAGRRAVKQRGDAAAAVFGDMAAETPEPRGFLAVIARRTDKLFQERGLHPGDYCGVQRAGTGKICEGFFDVGPRRVLGKEGAGADFKAFGFGKRGIFARVVPWRQLPRRGGRPPSLGTEMTEQCPVNGEGHGK